LIGSGSGGGDGSRDRVGILRDMQRRRGHRLSILASFEARDASTGLRGGGQLAWVGGRSRVGHVVWYRVWGADQEG
jgi:hypothetical protein